jgi:novobiocin biosynthesis protein NovH
MEGFSVSSEGDLDRTPPTTLAGLWERTAQVYRDRTAIVSGGESLSYGEVNERANRMARMLVANGAGPDRLVALALPRSVLMVVSVLAVAKAGAAFLPVDTAYPADRIAHMLSDADPVLLCTTRAAAAELAGVATVPTLTLDAARQVNDLSGLSGADVTDGERRGPLSAANLAYVIYTSGSTGRPKGVAVTHAGLPGLGAAKVEAMAVTADSRLLQVASPSFDAFLTDITATFTAGAALVVPDNVTLAGEPLTTALRDNRITHAVLTPAAAATVSPDDTPDLRTLVVAGEACPEALVATWAPRVRMINAYGPTENTVCATMSDPLTPGDTITIGRPMRGVAVYIVDSKLNEVPPGGIGDLYVAGDGLARGYLGRPALTAERFVANPFSDRGERMYRTGDLASWRPDGTILFHGRDDDQVKLRGFRIELGEVEAALARHPGVAQAVVVLRDKQLVAYVVPVDGAALTPADLRDHAIATLPDFMVPGTYSMIDALPLSVNGKVDRTALPEPTQAAATPGRQPRTPAEKTLCLLFGELFDAADVAVDSNFFTLGGTSILAIEFIQRANDAGLVISPRAMIEHPTIEALAAVATARE